jgi:hypothetical protein
MGAAARVGLAARGDRRCILWRMSNQTMSDQKRINFTIVPDESHAPDRIYANFCAITHTPFDFTLTFCEVLPPTQEDLQASNAAASGAEASAGGSGGTERVLRAPVRVRLVVPTQFLPNLVAALQDHIRIFSESYNQPPTGWKDPVH